MGEVVFWITVLSGGIEVLYSPIQSRNTKNGQLVFQFKCPMFIIKVTYIYDCFVAIPFANDGGKTQDEIWRSTTKYKVNKDLRS